MLIKKIVKLFSKISVRLLLFNILLIFFPIAFFFYLDIYESKLLVAQESSMVMQGRIISSSLNGSPDLANESNRIIKNLNKNVTSRIRILTNKGELLVDSSSQETVKTPEETNNRYSKIIQTSLDNNFLYKLVRFPLNFTRYVLGGPTEDTSSIEYYQNHSYSDGYEINRSLQGFYGATTRISSGGERSVTLYISLPIFDNDNVIGVVLLSKSTYLILQDLYQIRLEILKIFLVSLTMAILISLFLAKTIASPIKSLRNQAKDIVDKRGKLVTSFKKSKRLDEIGELSVSLQELTVKLQSYTEKTESFASDLSHEFKNPLSSIKTATEIIKSNNNNTENVKFIDMIESEVSRLSRLITDVREIAIIDSQVIPEDGEVLQPIDIIDPIISNFRLKTDSVSFNIVNSSTNSIRISPLKFSRVIENIISNAISFSPINSEIEINIKDENNNIHMSFKDQGSGIPKQNIDKIFNRFFTYRDSNTNRNSGLGLSISLAIIKVYGGTIEVSNNTNMGANFTIILPIINA